MKPLRHLLALVASVAAFSASATTIPFGQGTVAGTGVVGNTTSVLVGGGAVNNAGMRAPVGSTLTIPPGWAVGQASGSGLPEFRTQATGPVPGVPSKSVPIDVAAKATRASTAKALANFAKRGIPIVSTALAIAELLKELNLNMEQGVNGDNPVYEIQNPCVGTTCYGYSWWFSSSANSGTQLSPSKAGACGAAVQHFKTVLQPSCTFNGSPCTWTQTLTDNGDPAQGATCTVIRNGNTSYNVNINPTITTEPLKRYFTEGELADKIAERETWPQGSKISEAVRDAIASGRKVEVEKPTVSGPSSVPGPTSTKTESTPTQTTTSTTNQTINVTYEGDSYTTRVTSTTITNITNNTTNETTTTTTEENEETPQEEDECKLHPDSAQCQPEGEVTDTELPEVPDLYEQKYPDGIGGVWDQKKPLFEQSPLFGLINALMPSIAPGGTCPQWLLNLNGLGAQWGTFDVSPPCSIWPIIAAIVIVSALLLARKLIFGG